MPTHASLLRGLSRRRKGVAVARRGSRGLAGPAGVEPTFAVLETAVLAVGRRTCGLPGEVRTHDLQDRALALWSAELRRGGAPCSIRTSDLQLRRLAG